MGVSGKVFIASVQGGAPDKRDCRDLGADGICHASKKRGIHVDGEVGSRGRMRVPARGVRTHVAVQFDICRIVHRTAVDECGADHPGGYCGMRDLLPASRRFGGDESARISVPRCRVPTMPAPELCNAGKRWSHSHEWDNNGEAEVQSIDRVPRGIPPLPTQLYLLGWADVARGWRSARRIGLRSSPRGHP